MSDRSSSTSSSPYKIISGSVISILVDRINMQVTDILYVEEECAGIENRELERIEVD